MLCIVPATVRKTISVSECLTNLLWGVLRLCDEESVCWFFEYGPLLSTAHVPSSWSWGDDLASLEGLKRSVRVGAQVLDVAQPAIWVGVRLRRVGIRVRDRHARVALIG